MYTLDIIGFVISLIGIALFATFIWSIILYIIQVIFLNKLNKRIYGEGAWQAWVPFAQFYLLGKLTYNRLLGWILFVCSIITGNLFILDVVRENNGSSSVTLFSVIVIGLLIYAVVKYIGLKDKHVDIKYERAKSDSMSLFLPNHDVKGTKYCPHCGAVQEKKSSFCTNCGKKI